MPIGCFYEQLVNDDVDDYSEGNCRLIPMPLEVPIWWDWVAKSILGSKKGDNTVPKCQNNPFPEYLEGEMLMLLTCLINFWVFESKLFSSSSIVGISFKKVSEKTMPTCPQGIV
jgi:hypothetical protein